MTAGKKISLDFGGMSDKQVEDIAAGTLEKGGYPLPTPADAEVAKAQRWEMLNDSIVRRVTQHQPTAQQLTEVFNFTTRTCHQIHESLKDGTSSSSAVAFADVNREWVEEAATALRHLGGRAFKAS